MDDPYLKEINANVVIKVEKDDKYYVILDRTIFYPHLAGGQPKDKGTIEGIEVIDVYEENDKVIHVLREDLYTDKVNLSIDWDNRFDLMQQHTGQHLLSANLYSLYNAETDSFHFGKDSVSININKETFSEKEARQIEFLTNRMILSNLKINSYYPDSEELSDMPIRKIPMTDDYIRVVEITGLDYSACCGTHLDTTGEIGLVKIKKWHSNNGVTKIEFVCGNRALRDYSKKNNYISDLTKLLLTSEDKLIERTSSILDQNSKLEKEIKSLKEDLTEYKGELLLGASRVINGVKLIMHKFEDEDFKDVTRISSYLDQKENIIQIYSIEDVDTVRFIVTRSKNIKIDLNSIFNDIKKEINVKGGGSNKSIQGAIDSKYLETLVNTFAEKILAVI